LNYIINELDFKNWQQWGKMPDKAEPYNIERVKGNLPEMESTKQLVNLVSDVFESGMNILDVGCNVGHYLVGLRRKFPNVDYTGVDAYEQYISQAKEVFKNDQQAKFEQKDIFKPLFPNNPFDIVYCCNVMIHLPDIKRPIENLLNSTKKVCFIRTLIDDYTTIVKSALSDSFDENGEPVDYWYLNTWKKEYVQKIISNLGWKSEIIDDDFNPKNIEFEYNKVKTDKVDKGTRIESGKQIVENITFNWKWIKIFK
jgi:2-polyprenyl-3-methyl-5-hydroxy-6-metoxy-1,4-benzoquinol methylase